MTCLQYRGLHTNVLGTPVNRMLLLLVTLLILCPPISSSSAAAIPAALDLVKSLSDIYASSQDVASASHAALLTTNTLLSERFALTHTIALVILYKDLLEEYSHSLIPAFAEKDTDNVTRFSIHVQDVDRRVRLAFQRAPIPAGPFASFCKSYTLSLAHQKMLGRFYEQEVLDIGVVAAGPITVNLYDRGSRCRVRPQRPDFALTMDFAAPLRVLLAKVRQNMIDCVSRQSATFIRVSFWVETRSRSENSDLPTDKLEGSLTIGHLVRLHQDQHVPIFTLLYEIRATPPDLGR